MERVGGRCKCGREREEGRVEKGRAKEGDRKWP